MFMLFFLKFQKNILLFGPEILDLVILENFGEELKRKVTVLIKGY